MNRRSIRSYLKKNSINLMYIPALILFSLFVVYVFIDGVHISFTNWNGYSQDFSYVGIANYIRLFTSKNIRGAFLNTLVYGFVGTLFINIVGLGYALLLNQSIKGRNIVRAIIYLPSLIAPLIMGYIFYFLFQYERGALNDVLLFIGLQPIDWLKYPNISIILITFIQIFQFCGVSMIVYIAGLQAIPDTYYEAVELAGATKWQRFRYVTLPLLIPAIRSSVLLNLIGGLKIFGPVIALTNGGPGYSTHSLSSMTANAYFQMQNAGFSSAIGIFTFVFILCVSLIGNTLLEKRRVEY